MRARLTVSAILAVLGLLSCSSGGGDGAGSRPTLVFGPPGQAETGGAGARSLVLMDLDGDGLRDAVVANETFASASVLRGRPAGGFHPGVALPAPLLVSTVAVGDLDGDRLPDLVSASGSSAELRVALGLGAGAFAGPALMAAPWPVRKALLADWDADGRLDLILASAITTEIAVLQGDGAGTFGAAVLAATSFLPADMALLDANLDGRLDLVVCGSGAGAVAWFRDDGQGGFLPAVATATPALGGRMVVADVLGDGLPELLVLSADRTAAMVLAGDGAGGFALQSTRSLGASFANSLALGDLDHDGNLDLVVANTTGIAVCYGLAGGAFRAPEVLGRDPRGATWVVVADFRGTGSMDVAYLSGGDRVAWLLHPGAAQAGLANYGTGTPDCGGRIGMWASSSPRRGNAGFTFLATNAPEHAMGLLLQGGPQDLPGSDVLGLGVLLHLQPGFMATRVVTSDGLGSCRMPQPLPGSSGLVGLPLYAQTIWMGARAGVCSSSPLGFSSSVGLVATLQR
jgi:hypothetical protein